MSAVKDEVAALLRSLPDDCRSKDVQYHFWVLAKVRRGTARAEAEDALSAADTETRLARWIP